LAAFIFAQLQMRIRLHISCGGFSLKSVRVEVVGLFYLLFPTLCSEVTDNRLAFAFNTFRSSVGPWLAEIKGVTVPQVVDSSRAG